ncbi:MAG TPA: zf-HC2 domain-containing protein [Firmicutes bacterium]|nr:zf-HC2 domain-containing protein [Bacillota bacterium]
MDDCTKITDLLEDYYNHRLSGQETALVLFHLAVCQHCREEAAFVLSLKNTVSSMYSDLPSQITDTAFDRLPAAQEHYSVEEILGLVRDSLLVATTVIRFAYHYL